MLLRLLTFVYAFSQKLHILDRLKKMRPLQTSPKGRLLKTQYICICLSTGTSHTGLTKENGSITF
jgi:hypothetical protein